MKALALEKIHQINALLSDGSCMHNGLMGGTLGLVYYYFHLADILQDPVLQERAETMLATVFDELNGEDSRLHGVAYSSGASGLAYVVNNLQKNDFIAFDIASEFTDLDEYLFVTACEHMERGEIDYLHGAMGPFHYFGSRQQDPAISNYLNTLARDLLDRCVVPQQGQGIYFINNSLERLRGNKADFGLAHGLSGLLLLLIAAWAGLEDKAKAEIAIKAGIAFIMQFETEADPGEEHYSLFPFTVEAGQPLSLPNRIAWCYGDLNIALLLYRAGKLFNEEDYIARADKIGRNAITRKTPVATQSTDSHFCHGSAGLAQFYKCLYRETGNSMYADAYEYWIAETLRLVDGDMAKDQYKINPVSLLDGWPGVGLVLADYLSDKKRDWADVFLL